MSRKREPRQQSIAIAFSANPKTTNMEDAIAHLANNPELYFSVGYDVDGKQFVFPIEGYINVRKWVRYRATISDIVPYSPAHSRDPQKKPGSWMNQKLRKWKTSLIITKIETFSYDTYALTKSDGATVRKPLRRYVRIRPPENV